MKKIKAWAVILSTDANFIPDFSVEGVFENVMQIHSDKKSAKKIADKLGEEWKAIEIDINIK